MAAGVEFIPADDEKGPGLRLKHKAASAGYSRRKLLDRMIAAQALVHRATLSPSTPMTSPMSLVSRRWCGRRSSRGSAS